MPNIISKSKKRVFLDYAAGRANPNSIYSEGREARARIEDARKSIASVISSASDEVVLTSWGTDGNAYLLGLVGSGDHVITSSIEHRSMLDVFARMEEMGAKVTYLKPNSEGLIKVSDVEKALRKNTKLVSIMYANNEIGTIQPIKEIARMLRNQPGQRPARPLLHSDCVQAPGLLPINMRSLGVDMATFSAPKFGGPAGAGFMFVRRGVTVPHLRDSINIEQAEVMAKQLGIVEKKREKEVMRLTKLRDYFISGLLSLNRKPGFRFKLELNGSLEHRLANNINIASPIESELLVLELDKLGISASAGAACSSREGQLAPRSLGGVGYVILALGKSVQEAKNSVRFSLGSETSKSDLDYVLSVLPKIINKHTNIWQTR